MAAVKKSKLWKALRLILKLKLLVKNAIIKSLTIGPGKLAVLMSQKLDFTNALNALEFIGNTKIYISVILDILHGFLRGIDSWCRYFI